MNQKEAIRFVHDWLWESKDRLTEGESWLHRYISDVASMISKATAQLSTENQTLTARLGEATDLIDGALVGFKVLRTHCQIENFNLALQVTEDWIADFQAFLSSGEKEPTP